VLVRISGLSHPPLYKLHKMTDHNNGQVLNADFIFPANNTEKYFEYLESWSGRMPANVAAISLINYNDLAGEVLRPFSNILFCHFSLTQDIGPSSRQLGLYWTRKRSPSVPGSDCRSAASLCDLHLCALE
jgi:hypothetical protein